MNNATKEELIAFESRIREIFETGELPFLIHFCGGNEQQLIDIFAGIEEGDWILSSHRAHYHYLLAGGSAHHLEKMIRDGDSMFIFDSKLNFLTSSVLAGVCCIAAGIAWSIKEEAVSGTGRLRSQPRVWCFLGDGGEDQGHFYEAVAFVHGHKLPCTFIIEDNNRSVDTNVRDRRGEAHSLFPWPDCVRRYHYIPTYPHGGSGTKNRIQFKEGVRPRP